MLQGLCLVRSATNSTSGHKGEDGVNEKETMGKETQETKEGAVSDWLVRQ